MRVAKALALTDPERNTWTRRAHGRSTGAGLAQRATIDLAVVEGRANQDIWAEREFAERMA